MVLSATLTIFLPTAPFTLDQWTLASAAEVSRPGDTSVEPPDRSQANLTPRAEINPEGYTSSRVCGSCHVDIYRTWKNSLHAFSLSDPIFDAAYMQAIKVAGDAAKQLCLRCHAPMTQVNQDFALREGVTTEGVSCDFCHTVTMVHLDRPDKPYSCQPGIVKRSVLKDISSPAHQVEFSALHSQAEFCGGCHNYTAPNGTPIMSTYDEWKNGPYAATGIQCQDCHMTLRAGHVVSKDVKESAANIHYHDLIHDSDQLRGALDVEILRAERSNGELQVMVQVENVGSGHKVPTGIPSRAIRLQVRADAHGESLLREQVYRKVLADSSGRRLTQDYEMLLFGAMVLSDNRINPGEKRIERFRFGISHSDRVNVVATLSYVYAPMVLERKTMTVTLDQASRAVN